MRAFLDTLNTAGRTSRRRFVLGTGAGLALGFVLPGAVVASTAPAAASFTPNAWQPTAP